MENGKSLILKHKWAEILKEKFLSKVLSLKQSNMNGLLIKNFLFLKAIFKLHSPKLMKSAWPKRKINLNMLCLKEPIIFSVWNISNINNHFSLIYQTCKYCKWQRKKQSKNGISFQRSSLLLTFQLRMERYLKLISSILGLMNMNSYLICSLILSMV